MLLGSIYIQRLPARAIGLGWDHQLHGLVHTTYVPSSLVYTTRVNQSTLLHLSISDIQLFSTFYGRGIHGHSYGCHQMETVYLSR